MLLTFLAVTVIAIIRARHLFAVVMLTGVFSLLSAALLVQLDAVDVAFTEAAVGAGISTVLMLGTLTLTARRERVPDRIPVAPVLIVTITGAALVYGTLDMPNFGDPTAPAHHHIVPEYIEGSEKDIDVPNIVTSILASYRGFDTLGEVAVVFTAGVGVLLLLSGGGMAGSRRGGEMDESIAKTPQADSVEPPGKGGATKGKEDGA